MSPDPKKRPQSPTLIPNPFIKKRNLEWTIHSPVPAGSATTFQLSRSPPSTITAVADTSSKNQNSTAAVESGAVEVGDHLAYFASHLSRHILESLPSDTPTLSIPSYISLYQANAGSSHGAHFVIHQHDHPVAGTHYDLRLQINETSSVSWAIMYGLPGDPNSVRLNRNATETRIHSLWNHLIETASSTTGSLLIWDTGTYTILPRRSKHDPIDDPLSLPNSLSSSPSAPLSPQSLLHAAFQNRKIRLQLHGTKLPDPYVLNLRLTKSEDASGRAKSRVSSTRRTRRRRRHGLAAQTPQPETSSEEDETGQEDDAQLVPTTEENQDEGKVSAIDREIREVEDEETRQTNAYPGSSNTIGSIPSANGTSPLTVPPVVSSSESARAAARCGKPIKTNNVPSSLANTTALLRSTSLKKLGRQYRRQVENAAVRCFHSMFAARTMKGV